MKEGEWTVVLQAEGRNMVYQKMVAEFLILLRNVL